MNRRDFLGACMKAGIGISGAAVFFKAAGFKTYALDSILERKDSVVLDGTVDNINASPLFYVTKKLADGDQYPSVAVDAENNIWVAFTSKEGDDSENIYLSKFEGGKFSAPIKINEETAYEYDPKIINTKEGLAIVWTSKRADKISNIRLRFFKDEKLSDEKIVSSDCRLNWKADIAKAPDGSLWIAWERKKDTVFEVAARSINNGKFSDIITISDFKDNDCRRPSAAVSSAGILYCAYDVYTGDGNCDIYLASANAGKIESMQISKHPAMDVCSSIDIDNENNIWVVWHSNRKDKNEFDIPRWFEIRCVKDGKIFEPVSAPKGKDLTRDGENQSFEFPQVVCAPDGKIIVLGRPSHNFCMQYYYGGEWSPLYRLAEDGWGGRGKVIDSAFAANGDFFVVRRDIGSNALQKISGLKKDARKPLVQIASAENGYSSKAANLEEKIKYDPFNNYNYYFGEMHGHTWMSDGMNDLDEYYLYYKDFLKYDFAVLTDHDNFVSNFLLPSEWQEQKEMAAHYNKSGEFVTLFGQEWTTGKVPKGFGHKNIYHTDSSIELFDHKDKRYDTTEKLFKKLKEIGAICAPHHIGWTGVDWENHDPSVQTMVEIVSNHGSFEYMGNKPIYHRGGLKGNFVIDGLKRGLKFGIVGGSDCHGLIWHHRVGWKRNCHNTGLTCVLANELTPTAIFDAMKKRRVYATSGPKIKLEFTINDKFIMGDEATIKKDEPVKISTRVTSPEDVKWIITVKDGEDFNITGGENMMTRVYVTDENPGKGEHFYYLRIITENGNMAWTSPIWIKVV